MLKPLFTKTWGFEHYFRVIFFVFVLLFLLISLMVLGHIVMLRFEDYLALASAGRMLEAGVLSDIRVNEARQLAEIGKVASAFVVQASQGPGGFFGSFGSFIGGVAKYTPLLLVGLKLGKMFFPDSVLHMPLIGPLFDLTWGPPGLRAEASNVNALTSIRETVARIAGEVTASRAEHLNDTTSVWQRLGQILAGINNSGGPPGG
uniref:Orf203 n=1 Tax=Analipus japonicus TaxID=31333 RepID=A0A8F0FD35_9PHAE|nr:orf203 [Analipus japonicus]